MWHILLADTVVSLHFGFILFMLFGALLFRRWPWLIRLHLPMAAYGFLMAIFRWPCPLTPLEKFLRDRAGEEVYQGGFIGHYLIPIIYPGYLPLWMGLIMAAIVLVVNVLLYRRFFKNKDRAL